MITISGVKIGDGERPYIIAEMACAHDGDVDKAYKLVDMAAAANADAIQLQIFHTAEIVVPKHHLYPLLEAIEFSQQEWVALARHAKGLGLHVLVCTYDVPSIELAIKMGADGVKLNSADLLNFDVLKDVSLSKLPFTLGTGASSIDEITKALSYLESLETRNVILMHGVQNFPTEIANLNIERVKLLKTIFKLPVGYHDHTDAKLEFSKYVDLIAVGLGANVIEKHITLDRSEKGTDYQAALEPEEFKVFVDTIHTAYSALGSMRPSIFSDSDLKYRTFQKKSIVVVQDLRRGEILTRDKVQFLRNITNGLPPSDFSKLDGQIANRHIDAFENVSWKDFE